MNNFRATGQPIPIVIQGMVPTGGPAAKITVDFTVAGQQNQATTSLFYNVYTGLNVAGAAAPQQQLIQQIAQASGYVLKTDNSGNVWRTGEVLVTNLSQSYMVTFASYLNTILNNANYAGYTNENGTTIITSVATPTLTPGVPDSFDLKSLYPGNIAAWVGTPSMSGDGDNGMKFEAAIIIHALQEQYQSQILGQPFEVSPAKKDAQKGGAYGAGVIAEQNVLAWGTRVYTSMNLWPPVMGQFRTMMTFTYTNANNNVTVVQVMLEQGTDKFLDATLKLPGQ